MEGYFYHGIEQNYDLYGIEVFLKILKSGEIKKRNIARINEDNDEDLNHVCLYRRNDDVDYTQIETILKSARGNWINHGFVFIISPDIEAKYIPPNTQPEDSWGLETNLVDEWRTKDNITLDKIVGVALPLDDIQMYLQEEKFSEEEVERESDVKEYLKEIDYIIKKLGLRVVNSNIENFTDKLDAELQDRGELTLKDIVKNALEQKITKDDCRKAAAIESYELNPENTKEGKNKDD